MADQKKHLRGQKKEDRFTALQGLTKSKNDTHLPDQKKQDRFTVQSKVAIMQNK
jgi:hypothetical protein